jgi:hypothetical protein
VNHDTEYRYTPGQIPGPCTEHPGCFLTACRRLWCTRPVHVALISRGQPRRYCSPACRVAEHRRLRG